LIWNVTRRRALITAMDKDDEYRKLASDAQHMADRVSGATDKESWLRIAQGWMSLIRGPRQPEQEARQQFFDDEVKAHGTGQDDSTGSH
jgi:hypothetical protein